MVRCKVKFGGGAQGHDSSGGIHAVTINTAITNNCFDEKPEEIILNK